MAVFRSLVAPLKRVGTLATSDAPWNVWMPLGMLAGSYREVTSKSCLLWKRRKLTDTKSMGFWPYEKRMFKVSSFVMGLKFFPVNLKEKSLDNVFIPVRKGMMIQF